MCVAKEQIERRRRKLKAYIDEGHVLLLEAKEVCHSGSKAVQHKTRDQLVTGEGLQLRREGNMHVVSFQRQHKKSIKIKINTLARTWYTEKSTALASSSDIGPWGKPSRMCLLSIKAGAILKLRGYNR